VVSEDGMREAVEQKRSDGLLPRESFMCELHFSRTYEKVMSLKFSCKQNMLLEPMRGWEVWRNISLRGRSSRTFPTDPGWGLLFPERVLSF
jgi:hypothetical protein